MSQLLLETHRQNGNWRRAAKQLAFNAEQFVCTPLDTNQPLGWDFLENDRQRQRLHRGTRASSRLTSRRNIAILKQHLGSLTRYLSPANAGVNPGSFAAMFSLGALKRLVLRFSLYLQ